jgi:indolepyruvate ferredoxin oxidoreductase beta subunit
METMNIYLTGVGGQGIGMISEILLRAADHAGKPVIGVDTHGLAQRGGIVVSHLRIGTEAYTPLIRKGSADLVVALERHEALRAAVDYLKPGGTLVYYDTVWQPLPVRLNEAKEIKPEDIETHCLKDKKTVIPVIVEGLADARMQNIAVLACIGRHGLVPGVHADHYKQAMDDLMTGSLLEKNMKLFLEQLNLYTSPL